MSIGNGVSIFKSNSYQKHLFGNDMLMDKITITLQNNKKQQLLHSIKTTRNSRTQKNRNEIDR